MKTLLILLIALTVVHQSAEAQHGDHEGHSSAAARNHDAGTAEFVRLARAGAERYRDRENAIRAGFRRVGGDFPFMGEHWVNAGKIVNGKFDPSDPPILTYVTLDGQPKLLGVVYAVALKRGESPPSVPGSAGGWHEHNASVDEESFAEHSHGLSASGEETRLAILHLWLELPNPDGLFKADNLALPFFRRGLRHPSKITRGAASALALASGSDEFFRMQLQGLTESEAVSGGDETLEPQVRDAADSARQIVTNRNGVELNQKELAELGSIWEKLHAALQKK